MKQQSHSISPAERKMIYRVMAVVGVFALPLFRLTLPESSWDPIEFRLTLSGLCAFIFAASFLPFVTDLAFTRMVYVTLSMIIGWFEALVFFNDYSYEYTSTWFIVFFTLSLIIQKTHYLRFYTLIMLSLPSVLWFLCEEPQFPIHLLLPLSAYGIVVLNVTLGLRIRGEQILENRSDQYRMITQAAFEGSNDGILVADLEGRALEYNGVFEKMWNLPPGVLESGAPSAGVDLVLRDHINPVDWMRTIEAIRKDPTLETWDVQRFKDQRIIERISRPLLKDGRSIGRLWFFRDVTRQKQAEEQIMKNLALLRAVFDLSGVGILVVGEERQVLDYNELYLRIWNMDPNFLTQSHPDEVVKWSQSQLMDEKKARESMNRLLDSPGENEPETLYFKNGKIVERMARYLEIEGRRQGWVFFYRDITERVQAGNALRESESRNRAIVTAIPDQLLRLSDRGTVLDFVSKESQVAAGEFKGLTFADLFPREFASRVLEKIQTVLRSGEIDFFEESVYEGGRKKEYEARIAPSGPSEVLLILRDITDKKTAQDQLTQRNFELDSFIYRASHDLKAPLNSLMGLLGIVRGEVEDPMVKKYLDMMDVSILKLDTFIRNLALFSKNENQGLTSEPVDVQALANEVMNKLAFLDSGGAVKKEISLNGPATFTCDPFRLELVLENLISNSLKYSKAHEKEQKLSLALDNSAEGLSLTVTDNGIGIGVEHLPRIFDMFFRATNQAFGSGMGLYLVKNAIDKMGGTIRVQSSPDAGTVVQVFIPAAKA